MNPEFEWGRVLIATALLSLMFIIPLIVIVRDQRQDRRRFGPAASSRPVRYGPDGARYREGELRPAGPRPSAGSTRPAGISTSPAA